MSSSEFLSKARNIIKENPRMFDALLEFERTKKLPKLAYRKRINLTIDENLLREFKRYCKEKGYNMSRLTEKYIKEELKKQ
jgi:hypothetical protein